MMRPVTCLSLLAALGAGLYLYQEKHTAQLLDREINRTVKQAEASHDRIALLKAEWALLNEPERLQGLAGQHLQLQSLAPQQFARLEDLPGRLPAPSATPVSVQPADEVSAPAPFLRVPPAAQLAAQPIAQAIPAMPRSAPLHAPLAAAQASATPAGTSAVVGAQLTTAKPAPKPPTPRALAAARPAQDAGPAAAPLTLAPRPFYVPVMPAYSPAPVIIHAPTVQTASAMEPRPASFATPYVGSALGMAHPGLAAPVPVATAYPTR